MIVSVERTIFLFRRFLINRYGLLASIGAMVFLALGCFQNIVPFTFSRLTLPMQICTVALVTLLCIRLFVARPERKILFERNVDSFETGLLLLANIYVGIQIAGGPQSWAQPAAYVAIALLVGFNERIVGIFLAIAALGFQAILHYSTGELPNHWTGFVTSESFIVIFSSANLIFLQVEVARRRKDHDRRLADEIRSMKEEARDFRLISTALSSGYEGSREQEESKLARGAVEAIHQGMHFMLQTLKKALDLQTCVLLWLDSTGRNLHIKELVTDSDMVNEMPISAHAGALGGILKNRLLLNLKSPRRGAKDIPYYSGPETIGSFVGVPVLDQGHLRGVLCADRKTDRFFTEDEEKLLGESTRQILRSIQTERILSAVERAKYEHERFYRASTMLNSALTLSQVYDTAFLAVSEIVQFDFGALTLYDKSQRKHSICRVYGEGREQFEGKVFSDNAGLVAMVVKNKHFLPAGDVVRDKEVVVFTKSLRIKGIGSLVILPLIVQDNAVGTFVFVSNTRNRFPKRIREMLGVICNQVAVSIENAKIYKRMEEMATTDGLTGLPNHRTFQSGFAEMIYRAERRNKPVSVVLADVDKFKLINDTYGHPVGDTVLRRIAAVVADQARKIDLVARYGGEEFAMILEETDSDGAKLFCERVREGISAQLMSCDKGSFRVTLSLGIATYPGDGKEKEVLIERADHALYRAKAGGRNKTVAYRELGKVKTACG